MSLAERCARSFSAGVAARGRVYWQNGRVELVEVGRARVRARVRGTEEYPVAVTRDGGGAGLAAACACPFAQRDLCKHIAAVLRAIDDGAPSFEPGGTGAVPVVLGDLDARDEAAAADAEAAHAAADDGDAGEEALSTEWRQRLAPIIDAAARTGGSPHAWSGGDQQLEYVLDLDRSRRRGVVAVRFFTRSIRADGDHGVAHPVRLTREDASAAVDATDRHLLGMLLCGAEPAREAGAGHDPAAPHAEGVAGSDLGPGSFPGLLPRLGATGRFGWLDGQRLHRLAWDERPWRFEVAVEDRGDTARVAGRLRRAGEERALAEALLVHGSGLAVFADHVAPVELPPGAATWLLSLHAGEVVVPAVELPALMQLVSESGAAEVVSLDDRLAWRREREPPVPILRIDPPDRDVRAPVPAWVEFRYGDRAVPIDSQMTAIADPSRRRLIERDLAAEAAALERLEAAGVKRPRRGLGADAELTPGEIAATVDRLLAAGWRVEARGRRLRGASGIHLRVRSDVDWFELSGSIDFGGLSVPLPELLQALRNDQSAIVLGDGSHGLLPDEWLARFGLMSQLPRGTGESLRFAPSQAALLDALLAPAPAVEVDERFARAREEMRAFEKVRPQPAPPGFQGELRHYQEEGLGWLHFLERIGFGGCLADDMGLGKTIQVLALLEERRTRAAEGEPRRPSLAVVPRSLVFNWRNEATRFTPELRVVEYVGASRGALRDELDAADLVITTYGTLRRDIDELAARRFDYVVLDEAQAIKNPTSQTARACRRLQASHKLALTGTPIENHLADLASIFSFLNPGLLATRALEPLLSSSVSEAALALLARTLRPFILRRTKEQVLTELPDKTEQLLFCAFDAHQRRLYDELRQHYRASLTARIESVGFDRSRIHVLEALLRLRQAACHPGLVDRARRDESSPKLDELVERLVEVVDGGHKALVFSQFTSFLELVSARLREERIEFEYLDGRTRDRQRRVERFQSDPSVPVFLLSIKAGGYGLNLTAADYVFILDPWWNPAVEAQAIDRAHRIGEERPVMAYRLIARGTVEEKLLELQSRKRGLAEAIISADNSLVGELTADDLQRLFA